MILRVQISASSYPNIAKAVAEFNNWPYRSCELKLSKNYLEIDLDNLPVFWNQFISQPPSLQNELRSSFIDAMREVPEDKIGVAFKKAMTVLSDMR